MRSNWKVTTCGRILYDSQRNTQQPVCVCVCVIHLKSHKRTTLIETKADI